MFTRAQLSVDHQRDTGIINQPKIKRLRTVRGVLVGEKDRRQRVQKEKKVLVGEIMLHLD